MEAISGWFQRLYDTTGLNFTVFYDSYDWQRYVGGLKMTLMLSVTQGATASSPHNRTVPRWERALMARSRALDTRYHLGSYQPIGTGIVPPGHDPAWLRALDHRSIGLDQRYHLGTFTLPVVS